MHNKALNHSIIESYLTTKNDLFVNIIANNIEQFETDIRFLSLDKEFLDPIIEQLPQEKVDTIEYNIDRYNIRNNEKVCSLTDLSEDSCLSENNFSAAEEDSLIEMFNNVKNLKDESKREEIKRQIEYIIRSMQHSVECNSCYLCESDSGLFNIYMQNNSSAYGDEFGVSDSRFPTDPEFDPTRIEGPEIELKKGIKRNFASSSHSDSPANNIRSGFRYPTNVLDNSNNINDENARAVENSITSDTKVSDIFKRKRTYSRTDMKMNDLESKGALARLASYDVFPGYKNGKRSPTFARGGSSNKGSTSGRGEIFSTNTSRNYESSPARDKCISKKGSPLKNASLGNEGGSSTSLSSEGEDFSSSSLSLIQSSASPVRHEGTSSRTPKKFDRMSRSFAATPSPKRVTWVPSDVTDLEDPNRLNKTLEYARGRDEIEYQGTFRQQSSAEETSKCEDMTYSKYVSSEEMRDSVTEYSRDASATIDPYYENISQLRRVRPVTLMMARIMEKYLESDSHGSADRSIYNISDEKGTYSETESRTISSEGRENNTPTASMEGNLSTRGRENNGSYINMSGYGIDMNKEKGAIVSKRRVSQAKNTYSETYDESGHENSMTGRKEQLVSDSHDCSTDRDGEKKVASDGECVRSDQSVRGDSCNNEVSALSSKEESQTMKDDSVSAKSLNEESVTGKCESESTNNKVSETMDRTELGDSVMEVHKSISTEESNTSCKFSNNNISEGLKKGDAPTVQASGNLKESSESFQCVPSERANEAFDRESTDHHHVERNCCDQNSPAKAFGTSSAKSSTGCMESSGFTSNDEGNRSKSLCATINSEMGHTSHNDDGNNDSKSKSESSTIRNDPSAGEVSKIENSQEEKDEVITISTGSGDTLDSQRYILDNDIVYVSESEESSTSSGRTTGEEKHEIGQECGQVQSDKGKDDKKSKEYSGKPGDTIEAGSLREETSSISDPKTNEYSGANCISSSDSYQSKEESIISRNSDGPSSSNNNDYDKLLRNENYQKTYDKYPSDKSNRTSSPMEYNDTEQGDESSTTGNSTSKYQESQSRSYEDSYIHNSTPTTGILKEACQNSVDSDKPRDIQSQSAAFVASIQDSSDDNDSGLYNLTSNNERECDSEYDAHLSGYSKKRYISSSSAEPKTGQLHEPPLDRNRDPFGVSEALDEEGAYLSNQLKSEGTGKESYHSPRRNNGLSPRRNNCISPRRNNILSPRKDISLSPRIVEALHSSRSDDYSEASKNLTDDLKYYQSTRSQTCKQKANSQSTALKDAEANSSDNSLRSSLLLNTADMDLHTDDPEGRNFRDVAQWLVSTNFVNQKAKDGKTLLFVASSRGNLELCKFLVSNGVNVNEMDVRKKRPLHCACEHGNLGVVKYLVENKAEINAVNSKGITALHFAVLKNHTEIVRYMIEHNANPNLRDCNGFTPLFLASINGSVEIARILLDSGANVNETDKDGWSPLHTATEYKHRDLCELLISRGANVNQQNKDKKTPLFNPAYDGCVELCELLIRRNADINHPDKKGYTPLAVAVRNDRPDVVKLLLKHGADRNVVTQDGKKLMDIAQKKRNLEICQILSKGDDE